MFQEILFPRLKGALVHPTNPRLQIRSHPGQVFKADNHVAPAYIDVMFQAQRDGLRAECLFNGALMSPDFLDAAAQAAGQHYYRLPFADQAAGDLAAQAPEVMQVLVCWIVRAVDPLHREAEGAHVPVAGDVYGFQMPQQGRPLIPRGVLGWIHHVIPVERAHGDELHIA